MLRSKIQKALRSRSLSGAFIRFSSKLSHGLWSRSGSNNYIWFRSGRISSFDSKNGRS